MNKNRKKMKQFDYVKIISLIALPLSLVKHIESHATYFQIFYILLGAYAFFKYSLFKNHFIQIISTIFIINGATSYFFFNKIYITEYIQLGSLISLIFYLRDKYQEYDFIKYSKAITIISLVTSIINYFSPDNVFKMRSFLGIDRVGGIVGEPNFSLFAMTLPWIVFYNNKKYKWLSLISIPIFMVQSRSTYVFLIVFALLELISYAKPKLLKASQLLFLSLLFLSPIIITLTYNSVSNKTKNFLVSKVSPRFYLTPYYLNIGVNKPLGVGLTLGRRHFIDYGEQYREKVKIEANINSVELGEQHSIYNQILSEFGIIIYISIYLFLAFFLYKGKTNIRTNSFIATVSLLLFINGLNELNLFVTLAYCFTIVGEKKKELF